MSFAFVLFGVLTSQPGWDISVANPVTCRPGEIMIADKSNFSNAVASAKAALGGDGIQATGNLFQRGIPVEDFAQVTRRSRPKILIIHWSIFEPITVTDPGESLGRFIRILEQGVDGIHPHYIVYSGAFMRSPATASERIRFRGMPFEGIPRNRIWTIPLSGMERFSPRNGGPALVTAVRAAISGGACR